MTKKHFIGATYELTQENMNHLIRQLELAMDCVELLRPYEPSGCTDPENCKEWECERDRRLKRLDEFI